MTALDTPSIDGGVIDLGNVTKEKIILTRTAVDKSLPLTNSTGNVVESVLGVKRSIILKGTKKFSSKEILSAWILILDSWANQAVNTTKRIYGASSGLTYQVRPINFEYEVDVSEVTYTLELREVA